MRDTPRILDPSRLRSRPSRSFGWMDRRLLFDGYLPEMSVEEKALYLFLVLAGDRWGLSFYAWDRMSQLTGVEPRRLVLALDALVRKGLVVHAGAVYQVLALPAPPPQCPGPRAAPSHLPRSASESSSPPSGRPRPAQATDRQQDALSDDPLITAEMIRELRETVLNQAVSKPCRPSSVQRSASAPSGSPGDSTSRSPRPLDQ